MSLRSSLAAGVYLFETLLLAPGIVCHELAHVLACRLTGVTVTHGPVLNPLAEDAYVDHERVDSFPVDLAIAVAPLLVNTVLGLAALLVAATVAWPLSLPLYWLGGCLALTAFPSVGDTETLYRTAETLSWWAKPAAYLLAVPLRTATALPGFAGAAGFLWLLVLLGTSRMLL